VEQERFSFPALPAHSHRAMGIVYACITGYEPENKHMAWLAFESGEVLRAKILHREPERIIARGWQYLCVYPRFKDNQLVLHVSHPRSSTKLGHGYFEVQGVVKDIAGDCIEVGIWSQERKCFFTTYVRGYLPKALNQEVWCMECELNGGALVLIDAVKLAEMWQPGTETQSILDNPWQTEALATILERVRDKHKAATPREEMQWLRGLRLKRKRMLIESGLKRAWIKAGLEMPDYLFHL
jgi:hypothetical protein